MLISTSGKIASGKTEFVKNLVKCCEQQSVSLEIVALGDKMKDELNLIYKIVKSHGLSGYSIVSEELNVDISEALVAVNYVLRDLELNAEAGPYVKTVHSRRLMVFWAVNVRRRKDPQYWVKKAFEDIDLDAIKESGDRWLVVSDNRHLSELEFFKENNFYTVRLDVSEHEQAKRVLSRDNLVYSEADLNAPGEIELDNAEFDLRVQTDGLSEREVVDEFLSSVGLLI